MKCTPFYQTSKWRINKHSCILRLSCNTSTEITGQSWHSNIVPDLAGKLRLDEQCVVFHLTQRKYWTLGNVPIQDMVSSIMY